MSSQVLTIKVKLNPSMEVIKLLEDGTKTYISTINDLVSEMVESGAVTRKTSKDVFANLSGKVKNQSIREAISVFKIVKKSKFEIIPILRKPQITFNNISWSSDETAIKVLLMVDGKSIRVPINANFTERHLSLLKMSVKKCTLRITPKNGVWFAQIAVEIPTLQNESNKVLGIDLGIKVPAVGITDDNEVKFFGNGRKSKYLKRRHRTRRTKLGKAKKLKAIKKSKNREQRQMNDIDHKISREIVNFAQATDIGVIRLEKLSNIRQTTRTSRKNNKSLHTWSFYRLATYIEYKANLVGIRVEYVDPKYTSQSCPSCGSLNKAKDRMYKCSCGHKQHRDLVGASNIRYATVLDGKSLVA